MKRTKVIDWFLRGVIGGLYGVAVAATVSIIPLIHENPEFVALVPLYIFVIGAGALFFYAAMTASDYPIKDVVAPLPAPRR